jgi:hypothetical protein
MTDESFEDVFGDLRALMLREAHGMRVGKDAPGDLCVFAPWPHPRKPKEPMWFGMVRQGKAYVSFHLLPLYMNPAMQAKVTPELKKRMQGKACFNFKRSDPELFEALATLTRQSAESFATPLKF